MWLLLFSCLMSMEVDKESTVISFENKSLPSCNQKINIGLDSSVRVGFEIADVGGGWGSGNYFKLGKYKFVLTAAHVVQDGEVFVLDGEDKVSAEVIYINTHRDIAIIAPERDLEMRPKKLKVNAEEEMVGEIINYTGYPDDLGKTTYVGFVSKSDERGIIAQSFALPGSSGSVVFDKKGKAIGVVSAVKVVGTALSPFPELVESLVFIERVGFIDKTFLKEVFMNARRNK